WGMTKRSVRGAMKRFAILVLSTLALVFTPPAHAQDKFPSKPIKVVTAYGPGSATDIIIRILGEQLRQVLWQAGVVENKTGAYGSRARERRERARPDSYSKMIDNLTTKTITLALIRAKFSIDYEKYVVPLARIAQLPSFFVVTASPDFPPKTL